MLAFLVSYDIIRMKTEENVRIPLRLHNLSRFPERDSHSFISFYFYTLTEKGGLKAAFFLCAN